MTSLADALRAAIAPDAVQDDEATLATFRVHGMSPRCVATPGNLEELQAVMRIAVEQRAAVAPWGGGTQQLIGAPPVRLDLVVRTTRLNRVLAHVPDDLTISVEAGMTCGALRDHLARHGQMLALDPPLPERATIGGLIATATDGPRRLGYGTLRDILIGITVVEAGGRVSRGGGMVVKNVSGFDMMKLYLGSFGTLAVIASANFKLLPVPRASGTLLCWFSRAAQAFAALDELDGTQLTPTAAEFLNSGALAALGRSGACGVALAAEGLAGAVERHVTDMTAIVQRHGATETQRLHGDEAAAFWSAVADLSRTTDAGDDEALVKLVVLPADVAEAIACVETQAAQIGAAATINARALHGVVYARIRPVSSARLSALIASLPGVQWVATILPATPRWGPPPAGIELMQRIREEFDPSGLLNPGRFVPGLGTGH
ncbi:MAG: FAD-binding oxidoreductase [Chloroflexi bacterium]|nr:FAD-binding oxidoreductase [Chloroflexota bacterium]